MKKNKTKHVGGLELQVITNGFKQLIALTLLGSPPHFFAFFFFFHFTHIVIQRMKFHLEIHASLRFFTIQKYSTKIHVFPGFLDIR